MKNIMSRSALALSLLGSPALAQSTPPAGPTLPESKQQSTPAQPETKGRTTSPDYTIPPTGDAQPQNPQADQAKPAAVGPAQANTVGLMPDSPTPPGATPQTMPSTISQANAVRDKLLITAFQFPMTDDEKRLIASGLSNTVDSTDAAVMQLHVADFLPLGIAMEDFPASVTQQFPSAGRYKFVKTDNAILIIDPSIHTVVGELKRR